MPSTLQATCPNPKIVNPFSINKEKVSYPTISQTQEASLIEFENALKNAGNNILLMLFCYQAHTAYKLELQLSDLQNETEKRYHELRRVNGTNQRVQQHIQDAATQTHNSDKFEGTHWESVEYIFNGDYNYAEYLAGQKILQRTKDFNHLDFTDWKTKNPSAAQHLTELYESVRKKKTSAADESSSSSTSKDFASSYIPSSVSSFIYSLSSTPENNEQKIKLEDLIEEVDSLLLKPSSLTDTLKVKELCKQYGFTDEQYKKAFKDSTGRFTAATNMLSTIAKSIDTEIQKFATKIHNTTSDLHTLTEVMVSVMKATFDALKNTGRNV